MTDDDINRIASAVLDKLVARIAGQVTVAGAPLSVTVVPSAAEASKPEPKTDWRETVIRELHARGMTDSQIAKRIGMSQSHTSLMRRKLGLPAQCVFPVKKSVDKDRREKLINALKSGKSLREASVAAGYHADYGRDFLRRNGLAS